MEKTERRVETGSAGRSWSLRPGKPGGQFNISVLGGRTFYRNAEVWTCSDNNYECPVYGEKRVLRDRLKRENEERRRQRAFERREWRETLREQNAETRRQRRALRRHLREQHLVQLAEIRTLRRSLRDRLRVADRAARQERDQIRHAGLAEIQTRSRENGLQGFMIRRFLFRCAVAIAAVTGFVIVLMVFFAIAGSV
jgi:hypothetical protein